MLKLFIYYLALHVSICHAGALEYYVHKNNSSVELPAPKTVTSYYFNQLIDHENPAIGTFSQRYHMDETYGKSKNAPVFLYICGETICSKSYLNGAIRTHAKKYHAKLIALEHRYYGKSLPYPTLSRKHLKYLTTKTALQDLASFQIQISQDKGWTGPWIAFGGSYAGSLAAYYRLKYPALVRGALASSAPVMAKENFIEYDEHVTKSLGMGCAKKVREILHSIESHIDDETQFMEIKTLFNASKVEDPIDFLMLIADVISVAVYQKEAHQFCEYLTYDQTPMEGYASYTKRLLGNMRVSAEQLTPQGFMSEDPNAYKHFGNGMRQWFFQLCSEYGDSQIANPERAKSTRSERIDLNYQYRVCQRLFGLKKPANTELINKTYYFPLLDSSVERIYFTNGEYDPLSKLSLIKENNNTNNLNLTYYLIKRGAHCDDMMPPNQSDSKSLIKARNTIQNLLKQWVKH